MVFRFCGTPLTDFAKPLETCGLTQKEYQPLTVHIRSANKLIERQEPQFSRGANFKMIGY